MGNMKLGRASSTNVHTANPLMDLMVTSDDDQAASESDDVVSPSVLASPRLQQSPKTLRASMGQAAQDRQQSVAGDVASLAKGTRRGTFVTALELTGVDESERTAADKLPEISFGSAHDRTKHRKRLADDRMDSDLGSGGGSVVTESQAMMRPSLDDVTDVDHVGADELKPGNRSPEASNKSLGFLKKTKMATVDLEQERYDKMIAAESWMKEHHIINPMGTFRKRWDIGQVVLLTYVTFSVPYRIGFDHDTHPWEFWFVFDLLVDVYFIIDICLSFRTAFHNALGDLEYYPGQIIKHYMQTWLLLDLAGSAPVNYGAIST